MELVEFFRRVITGEEGWFCLAYSQGQGTEADIHNSWREEFYSWPDDVPKILGRIEQLGTDKNIYFSPYLFQDKTSLKDYAIVGRTIVADLDEASVLTLPLKPNVLVETSPDRHQGYWILKDETDRDNHEALSRKLTYSIPRCDKNGWFLGKKVRVPTTLNHKYVDGPKYVRIADLALTQYTTEHFDELYVEETINQKAAILEQNLEWANDCIDLELGCQEMMVRIRNQNPGFSRAYSKYNIVEQDRSGALWALMTNLFRLGVKREHVYYLAYNSVNNKFKELRYGGIRELAKDVLRAEASIALIAPDLRSKIAEARRLPGSDTERNNYIAKLIREQLERMGAFVHTEDGEAWYVRTDTGKPVQLSTRSEQLQTMIESLFSINGSERIYSFIAHNLYSYVVEGPVNGYVANLSYYDKDTKTFMLHTGKKDMLIVKSSGITRVANGTDGILFPWTYIGSYINPKHQELDKPWDVILFEGCLDNIDTLTKDESRAILKAWFLSVLLRDGLHSRPILALHGSPGSGKSTLFRRFYTLLYGRSRSLNSISKEDDFDYAVSSDPLVVFDNLDTYARWLPDRLAVMAAPNEIQKRKLFTDNTIIRLKRTAMLGITAHNPKFSREDIADRFLLFNFQRLEKFLPETEIIDRIYGLRDALWGSILKDIQTILATKVPQHGYPQFRVEDFSKFGYWICTALGCEDDFYSGLSKVKANQVNLVLEEDAMLVDALDAFIRRSTNNKDGVFTEFKAPGQLWVQLSASANDTQSFTRRYNNAVSLGKKLWAMYAVLRQTFDVEWKAGPTGSRVWSFARRQNTDANESESGVTVNGRA